MLTIDERNRLAGIRAALEKHRAMGVDVSSWEADFLLGIIERFGRRLRQAEWAGRN